MTFFAEIGCALGETESSPIPGGASETLRKQSSSALDSALVDRRAARFSDLGPTPYFAALFAVVNLHHYFMDFVIWRRDNPETKYLRA